MIEKALQGNRSYWIWIVCLLILTGFGVSAYSTQLHQGLSVTALHGGAAWGVLFTQAMVMASIAAGTSLVLIPAYLHENKPLGNMVNIAQFIGVSSAMTSLLFLLADVGKPQLLLDLARYGALHSPYFWVLLLLKAYIWLTLISGWATLGAEHKGVPAASWVKPLALLTIPVALALLVAFGDLVVSAHAAVGMVVVAPFLAAALAGGTALLMLVLVALKKTTGYDVGNDAIRILSSMLLYTGIAHVVLAFVACSPALAILTPFVAVALLCIAVVKKSTSQQTIAAVLMVLSLWFSNASFVTTGTFAPTSTGIALLLGIFAAGLFLLTILLKSAVAVKADK